MHAAHVTVPGPTRRARRWPAPSTDALPCGVLHSGNTAATRPPATACCIAPATAARHRSAARAPVGRSVSGKCTRRGIGTNGPTDAAAAVDEKRKADERIVDLRTHQCVVHEQCRTPSAAVTAGTWWAGQMRMRSWRRECMHGGRVRTRVASAAKRRTSAARINRCVRRSSHGRSTTDTCTDPRHTMAHDSTLQPVTHKVGSAARRLLKHDVVLGQMLLKGIPLDGCMVA